MTSALQGHAQVVLDAGHFGVQAGRFGQGRQGFVEAFLLDADQAQVVQAPDVVALDLQHLQVAINGLVQQTFVVADAAVHAVGVHVFGCALQGQFDLGAGLGRTLQLDQHAAVVDQALDVIGFDVQGGDEGLFGGVQFAGFPLGQAQHEEAPGIGGVVGGVGIEQVSSLGVVAIEVGLFGHGVGHDAGRLDREGLFAGEGHFRNFGDDDLGHLGHRRFGFGDDCGHFDDIIGAVVAGQADTDKNGDGQNEYEEDAGLGKFHFPFVAGIGGLLLHGGLLVSARVGAGSSGDRC